MKELVDMGVAIFGCPLYFESSDLDDVEEMRARIENCLKSLLSQTKSAAEYRRMVKETLGART